MLGATPHHIKDLVLPVAVDLGAEHIPHEGNADPGRLLTGKGVVEVRDVEGGAKARAVAGAEAVGVAPGPAVVYDGASFGAVQTT